MDFLQQLSGLPEDEIAKINAKLETLQKEPKAAKRLEATEAVSLKEFWQKLQDSEKLVWDLYLYNTGQTPSPPRYGAYNDANAEYGPLLHALNNLNQLPIINNLPAWLLRTIKLILRYILDMPRSSLSAQQWKELSTLLGKEGFAAGDGTMLQGAGSMAWFNTYVAYDPGWAYAGLMYVLTANKSTIENFLPESFTSLFPEPLSFPHSDLVVNLTPKAPGSSELKVALIGDFGAGTVKNAPGQPPADQPAALLAMIKELSPDVVIHLGDVYYAGTEKEERENFLRLLQDSGVDPKYYFTLNSNHEMYSLGNGYFKTALGDPLFSKQEGQSYFKLSYGKWQLLGLDSAFFDPSSFYMNGAIYDPGDAGTEYQKSFIKNKITNTENLIVMTHHDPIEIIGEKYDPTSYPLWDQVIETLPQGIPDTYWYWGHLHGGIVYNENSYSGQNNIKGRCCGHGAIPFGDAYYFQEEKYRRNIDYYAKPSNPEKSNRAPIGFTLLTLGESGSITEAFYEIGNPEPAWSKSSASERKPGFFTRLCKWFGI